MNDNSFKLMARRLCIVFAAVCSILYQYGDACVVRVGETQQSCLWRSCIRLPHVSIMVEMICPILNEGELRNQQSELVLFTQLQWRVRLVFFASHSRSLAAELSLSYSAPPYPLPLSDFGIDEIECHTPSLLSAESLTKTHLRISRSVDITNSTTCTHMAETTDDDGGSFINYTEPVVHCAAQNLTALPWWRADVIIM